MATDDNNLQLDEDHDLGAQLDALIEHVRQQEPDLVQKAFEDDAQAPSDESTVGAATTSDQEQPAADGDDTLGAQIDQMLDAQTPTASSSDPVSQQETPSESSADVENAPDLEDPIEEHIDEAQGQENAAAQEATAGEVEDSVAEGGAVDEESEDGKTLDAIDKMLAEQARQVEDESSPDDDASTEDEEALEGDFERPEDILGEPGDVQAEGGAQGEAGFNADADDVAQELDEQPETAAPDNERAERSKEATRAVPRGKPAAVVIAATVLKHTCDFVNKPMAYLPEGTRKLVGYVGVLTLFNGVVVFAYGLLKILLTGG